MGSPWARDAAFICSREKGLAPDPSRFKGDNRPVDQVSWADAQEFCKRLSVKTGKDYCLPSEAEWEYACRAGTTTPFHFGETITTELANYDGNSTYNNGPKGEYREETTDVGLFPANDWGLYDMHGSLWEWCEDDYHSDYNGAPDDGSAWVESDPYRDQSCAARRLLVRHSVDLPLCLSQQLFARLHRRHRWFSYVLRAAEYSS